MAKRRTPALSALVACTLVLGACGDSYERRLVALSDELARSCADVASRMVEGWSGAEYGSRRALPYPAEDLEELEDGRARCQGGLRLLEEIVAKRRRVREPLESNLRDLVVLDRLLLRSIVDPDMDRAAMEATVAGFEQSHGSLRPQIGRDLPLTAGEQQQIVGRQLGRWRELTPKQAGPP
jgi:hypothetical protein